MSNKKQTTIFRQLIFNVILPAILAILVLGFSNIRHTNKLLSEFHQEKKDIIYEEITNFLEFRDIALDILEGRIDAEMQRHSEELVNNYLKNNNNVEDLDLYEIREKLGMDPDFEDIYIINKEGRIINTTFKKDLNLDLFSFGEAHENMLKNVWKNEKFLSETFTIESSTKRLKKYSYQPSIDGEYIVELGVYSKKADEIINLMGSRIQDLSNSRSGIESINLFILGDHPFSLNSNAVIDEEHMPLVDKVLREKSSDVIKVKNKGKELHYDYIYMEREISDFYKGSVIRIVSDRSIEEKLMRKALFTILLILGIATIVVGLLIYKQTRIITDPIKMLVENVIRITDGHFNERAEVMGRNEITTLSQQFNMMISQLESYYNELEQKVKERTAEIVQQKEEIEAQRDALQEQRNILEKTNKSLTSAYTEIENQQKHITDSIHYASRIQNAILPPTDFVKSILPESFILYNPKDIVSGDFYWVSQKEERSYFAAVDCTGHGVPGAFMSIVGHNQLNYAVNVKGARKPANILNALNKGVTDTLRQKLGSATVKDGMDIALCCIDRKNMKLEFAGAYNPLLLFRDDELIQIKGDRAPIGAFVGEELHEFTHHEMDLKKGDIIYTFSDGYADQFGGPKGGKFLTKRFRELLSTIHKKDLEEQLEILLETYLEWKGSATQVDDILIIGVKI